MLCILSVVWPFYHAGYRSDGSWYEVCLHNGKFSGTTLVDNGHPTFNVYVDRYASVQKSRYDSHGFSKASGWSHHYVPKQITEREFDWSLVWLCIAFALYPIAKLVVSFVLLKRRMLEGRCQSCLYDLTGNVSGICPECGEKVVSAPKPIESDE